MFNFDLYSKATQTNQTDPTRNKKVDDEPKLSNNEDLNLTLTDNKKIPNEDNIRHHPQSNATVETLLLNLEKIDKESAEFLRVENKPKFNGMFISNFNSRLPYSVKIRKICIGLIKNVTLLLIGINSCYLQDPFEKIHNLKKKYFLG